MPSSPAKGGYVISKSTCLAETPAAATADIYARTRSARLVHHEPKPATISGLPVSDEFSPADRYAELFDAVQMSRVFSDSKTFVDCAPKIDPANILVRYREQSSLPGFNLADFVRDNFSPPTIHASHYLADLQQTLIEHIDGLWEVLSRKPEDHPDQSSLLPLPSRWLLYTPRDVERYALTLQEALDRLNRQSNAIQAFYLA